MDPSEKECTFEISAESRLGRVYRCRFHGHFQIEFGQMLLTYFDIWSLEFFADEIGSIDSKDESNYCTYLRRKIIFQPIGSACVYGFMPHEINDLQGLMAQATSFLDLEAYLQRKGISFRKEKE
ncbi:DUF6686 family protein [Runella sp.]|uniref:DUF6686 family protein n=1 Tax=Runella sp. TaxID=1960881 RepID=UPI003D13F388